MKKLILLLMIMILVIFYLGWRGEWPWVDGKPSWPGAVAWPCVPTDCPPGDLRGSQSRRPDPVVP